MDELIAAVDEARRVLDDGYTAERFARLGVALQAYNDAMKKRGTATPPSSDWHDVVKAQL